MVLKNNTYLLSKELNFFKRIQLTFTDSSHWVPGTYLDTLIYITSFYAHNKAP